MVFDFDAVKHVFVPPLLVCINALGSKENRKHLILVGLAGSGYIKVIIFYREDNMLNVS